MSNDPYGLSREVSSKRKGLGLVLRRGLRGRCPRCGEGQLFRRWLEIQDRCSECDLLYQRNYGDTWMFMIITDRVPLLDQLAMKVIGASLQDSNWENLVTGVVEASCGTAVGGVQNSNDQ